MRRVLVLWADDSSTNLGVRALAAGTEALVRRAWGEVEVAYLTYGRRDVPMRVGDPKAVARELVTGRRGLGRWMAGFDVVVDSRAGDSFSDIYGLRRHVTMSLLAEVAHRAGVPVVMGPQTLGPFESRRAALLARRSLATARLVLARDLESVDRAERIGRRGVVPSTDVVFALDRPGAGPRHDVLLNVSGLLWHPNPHVDHRRYQKTMTEVVRGLEGQGRRVSLLAHVLDSPERDNDVPALTALAGQLGGAIELEVPTDLDDVRRTLAGAAVVLGARMHACLNALSVGTPAVALAYSDKFRPLLDDLGWRATIDLRRAGSPVEEVLSTVSEEERLRVEVTRTVETAHVRLRRAEDALRELR